MSSGFSCHAGLAFIKLSMCALISTVSIDAIDVTRGIILRLDLDVGLRWNSLRRRRDRERQLRGWGSIDRPLVPEGGPVDLVPRGLRCRWRRRLLLRRPRDGRRLLVRDGTPRHPVPEESGLPLAVPPDEVPALHVALEVSAAPLDAVRPVAENHRLAALRLASLRSFRDDASH